MAKRTPERVANAKRLRAEGRSWAEVADLVSKGGKPVSEAAVRQWLKAEASLPSPVAVPDSRPAAAPVARPAASDGAEVDRMTPEQWEAWLGATLRDLQIAADEAKAAFDGPGQARFLKLATSLAPAMTRMQAKLADEGDVVRVRLADVLAAKTKVQAKVQDLVSRMMADRKGT